MTKPLNTSASHGDRTTVAGLRGNCMQTFRKWARRRRVAWNGSRPLHSPSNARSEERWKARAASEIASRLARLPVLQALSRCPSSLPPALFSHNYTWYYFPDLAVLRSLRCKRWVIDENNSLWLGAWQQVESGATRSWEGNVWTCFYEAWMINGWKWRIKVSAQTWFKGRDDCAFGSAPALGSVSFSHFTVK